MSVEFGFLRPSDNLVLSATITASSEDANYDADNLKVSWPAKEFRFNAAAPDDQITFDLGSALAPNLLAVFGHNLDSGVTSVDWLSDDNAGFASPSTENSDSSPATPSFYMEQGFPKTEQYRRLLFNGTNGAAGRIGEVAMGVKQTLSSIYLGAKPTQMRPQSRQQGGEIAQNAVENLTSHRQRSFEVSFLCQNYTQRDELVTKLFEDTNWGADPLIFIPDPAHDEVIHGRVPKELTWERNGLTHKTTFVIEEDPYSLGLT